jgi:hypothetical protein
MVYPPHLYALGVNTHRKCAEKFGVFYYLQMVSLSYRDESNLAGYIKPTPLSAFQKYT